MSLPFESYLETYIKKKKYMYIYLKAIHFHDLDYMTYVNLISLYPGTSDTAWYTAHSHVTQLNTGVTNFSVYLTLTQQQ